MYTIETLTKINTRFCNTHYEINDSDVAMANRYVEIIEKTRSDKEPKIGDIVHYTNQYGEYFDSAHLEREEMALPDRYEFYICERPSVAIVSSNKERTKITSCVTSGGAFGWIPKEKLIYVGRQKKTFCDWGHCGPCGDGMIYFDAEVCVWEYIEEGNSFINKETGVPFTTKDYKKMYLFYNQENTEYKFCGQNFMWKTDLELQAWLRTRRAEIFESGKNTAIVWLWREDIHSVSPKEFESLELPEDTKKFNGDILRCKRRYDEETHIIHTYLVWYWDEPGKDWTNTAAEQNEIRKKLFTLDYKTPENQFAVNEIISGKIKALDISFMKRK